jgi:hypothetical protein
LGETVVVASSKRTKLQSTYLKATLYLLMLIIFTVLVITLFFNYLRIPIIAPSAMWKAGRDFWNTRTPLSGWLQSFYVQCTSESVQVLVDVMQALEKQFKN